MILENHLERPGFGYAQLLLAAYHTDELALDTNGVQQKGLVRVESLWGFSHEELHRQLGAHDGVLGDDEDLPALFDQLFPNLRERMWQGKVNGDYNNMPEELHSMNLWLVQGSGDDLVQIWYNLFDYVSTGPQGGDDDTFDYWPSAWGVMLHMAEDLIELGVLDHSELEEVRAAWDNIAERYNNSSSPYANGEEFMTNELTPRPVPVR